MPVVQWAQRPKFIYLTYLVAEPQDVVVRIGAKIIEVSYSSGNSSVSDLLQLHDEINPEESHFAVKVRTIQIKLRRKEEEGGHFWPRLLAGSAKRGNLSVDWNLWKDEDEIKLQEEDEEMTRDFAKGLRSSFVTESGVTVGGGGDPVEVARVQKQILASIQ